jgi:hypothetical protein
MSDIFAQFDCPKWWNSFSMKGQAGLCRAWDGSTFLEVDLDDRDADVLLADPSQSGVNNLVSITDPVTGRVVVVNTGGLPLGAIIGIAVGAAVLLAILIVVVVLCCRRYKDRSAKALYVPLQQKSKFEYTPTPAPAAGSKTVSLRVIQAAIASGEGTVSASVNTIVQAETADFADVTSEWLWVKLPNGKAGYVPREFLRIQ